MQAIERRSIITVPYILSMTGGLITMVMVLLRPILIWFQEQLFLLAVMKRLFFYNTEDLNTLNPPEKRMLRRVMKLKSKKEGMNSTFSGEVRVEEPPELSNLDSITDLSSAQAGTILSQYNSKYSRPQTADLSRDGLRDLMLLKLSELKRMTFNLRDQICRVYCCCRKLRKVDLKREMLYQDGIEKLYGSLDVINLMQTIRKVNLMEKMLLSTHQTAFLPVTNGNLLDMNPFKPKGKPQSLENTFLHEENKYEMEEAVDGLIDSAASSEQPQSAIYSELIKDLTEYNIVNFNGEKARGHRRDNTLGSEGVFSIN